MTDVLSPDILVWNLDKSRFQTLTVSAFNEVGIYWKHYNKIHTKLMIENFEQFQIKQFNNF